MPKNCHKAGSHYLTQLDDRQYERHSPLDTPLIAMSFLFAAWTLRLSYLFLRRTPPG